MAYLPGMGRDFGVTVTGLAGALTGLLFVAVSLKSETLAWYIERASPNIITVVLVGVAGLTLLLTAGGGLYSMIPPTLASLVGGVINAWLFLVRVPGSAQ